MKVTTEHVQALKALIEPLDTEARREAYRKGEYPRAELTKDVNRRYRWDLWWVAKGYRAIGDAEYNDAHLDTALKSIVPTL